MTSLITIVVLVLAGICWNYRTSLADLLSAKLPESFRYNSGAELVWPTWPPRGYNILPETKPETLSLSQRLAVERSVLVSLYMVAPEVLTPVEQEFARRHGLDMAYRKAWRDSATVGSLATCLRRCAA